VAETWEEALLAVIGNYVLGPLSESGQAALYSLVEDMATNAVAEGYGSPSEEGSTEALERLDQRLSRAVRRYAIPIEGLEGSHVYEIAQALCPMPPFCRRVEPVAER
jgi:hypothetical protein